MKAAPIAIALLIFLSAIAFIPLPKAHATSCPFNGAAIDGLVEGHQSSSTGNLTLTLNTQCNNEAIEVFMNCVAESNTVPCGGVSDTAGTNFGTYNANNAWVIGFRFDGAVGCADTAGCGYLLNGHQYGTAASPLTNDVITITAGSNASAIVGAVAFGVFDANLSVPKLGHPSGPFDPNCWPVGGCDNNLAYNTSPITMDWGAGTSIKTTLLVAWPSANQSGFIGTPSGFSAVNFQSSGSGIYQWTNAFEYKFVSSTFSSTAQYTLPSGGHSVGMWGTWAIPLIGPPDTNVVVIQVVPCTFFELQCWWYPALMFGMIGGLFFSFGAAAEASSKSLIYLLLFGFTVASLIEVQMGMISIMFPLLFTVGSILFALRFDSGQDEGGGVA